MKSITEILDQAKAAPIAASQKVWDRDGHQDCGGNAAYIAKWVLEDIDKVQNAARS